MRVQSNQTAEISQSLLGAVRQKESTITRQLAAARNAAQNEIEEAKKRARQIVDQATEDGRLAGEVARRSALAEIELEATEIETQAGKEADALKNLDEETLKMAVNQALNIITGDSNG
jgi:vacuolar-type H+-ATPase subunit H